MSDQSISVWISDLKAGEQAAAQEIFEQYFRRLVGLARAKLQGARKRIADEEDVALDAFASFCRGVDAGRFPKLNDREDLWTILAMITARKAVDQIQHQNRQKRGGGQVHGESIFFAPDNSAALGLDQFAALQPTAEFVDSLTSQCQELFVRLEDENLQQVARLKMEGYSNEEIAEEMNCARRTVQRRLKLIQELWTEELDNDE